MTYTGGFVLEGTVQTKAGKTVTDQFGNPSLTYQRSLQYSVGVDQKLPLDVNLGVTLYDKYMYQLVTPTDAINPVNGQEFVFVENPAANPNSHITAATANLNANACYSNPPAAAGATVSVGEYACGDGSLASDTSAVSSLVSKGWTLANHTIDHLENYEPAPGWAGKDEAGD